VSFVLEKGHRATFLLSVLISLCELSFQECSMLLPASGISLMGSFTLNLNSLNSLSGKPPQDGKSM